MAEIFGLISFALGALAAADRAVVLFDRLQNAPKQMRLVWILLDQIKQDLSALRESNNNNPEGQQIPSAAFNEIKNALTECSDFLDRYSERFSSKGTLRRVFWSSLKTAELQGIRGRIAEIYPLIITPLTMRILLARMPGPVHGGQDSPMLLAQAAQAGAVVDMAPPPYGIAAAAVAAANGIQVPIPENAARQYEARQTEQELNAALSIKLRDILETDVTVEVDVALKTLQKATLTLQGDDIPMEYRTLKLDGLQVAARDEKTIMLRFSCNGGSIRVKHLVPFSTPPCLSAVESPDVYFRATHPITLLLDDSHLLLQVAHPCYHFNGFRIRRKFEELVRARKLVAEIEGVEVLALFNDDGGRTLTGGTTITEATSISGSSHSSGNNSRTRARRVRRQEVVCLNQSEPLQIWQQEEGGQPGCPGPGTVTVTFLADTAELSGGGGGARRDKWRVLEWHAEDLAGRAEVVAKAVEMWWAIHCVGAAPGVRITFRSKSDAETAVRSLVASRNMSLEKWARVVLQRYSGRFAIHHAFAFLVFNMGVRSRNRRISMLSVTRKHFPNIERIVQLLSLERLEAAKVEVEASGKTTDEGWKILFLIICHGIPAIWFTLNPNDLTNPVKLRLVVYWNCHLEEAEAFLISLDASYKYTQLGSKRGELCRFKAPWMPAEKTGFTEEGVLRVRHSHSMVNRWNKAIAVGLRHNHDISFIATQCRTMAIVYYVTDYATKVEDPVWKRAVAAAELIGVLREDPTGGNQVEEIRTQQFLMKVANWVFTDRALLQAEVMAHLLGYGMEFENKEVWTFLNVSSLYWHIFRRWRHLQCAAGMDGLDQPVNETVLLEDAGQRISLVQAYPHRGAILWDLSLYDYMIIKLQWKSSGGATAWGEVERGYRCYEGR
ncbi:hypothetical protein OQA88_5939 [Cercophora sp. LCS_1]